MSSVKYAMMLLKNKVFDALSVPKGHNLPDADSRVAYRECKKAFLCKGLLRKAPLFLSREIPTFLCKIFNIEIAHLSRPKVSVQYEIYFAELPTLRIGVSGNFVKYLI